MILTPRRGVAEGYYVRPLTTREMLSFISGKTLVTGLLKRFKDLLEYLS